MKNQPQGLRDWLGIEQPLNWACSRVFGGVCGTVLTLVGIIFAILFLMALVAAVVVIAHTIKAACCTATGATSLNLGAGALIAAALSAPLVIWGTILKHQGLRYQKEGHITDRINKAVEQLGSVKVIEKIGRPVTVWKGQINNFVAPAEVVLKQGYSAHKRTRVSAPKWDQWAANEDGDMVEGHTQSVSVWAHERTLIQWQGSELTLSEDEVVGVEHSWEVFKETVPNIEVRVGAILSLERIAQDSMRHDKGRDHVRVMEILCAYARENAAIAHPTDSNHQGEFSVRTDIQLIIDVLGRRTAEQEKNERGANYYLDLRCSDFRGVDFSKKTFKGAMFVKCLFNNSNLNSADFSGAVLAGAVLDNARSFDTKFVGAYMDFCKITKQTDFISFGEKENILGASLTGSDISGIDYIADGSSTFGSSDTIIHEDLEAERKAAAVVARGRKKDEPAEGNSPFLHWLPYHSHDLAANHMRHKLRKSLGLVGWPYDR